MARPYRIQLENGIYLLSFQGTENIGLFVEPFDCRHFLSLLSLIAGKQQVSVHAYALAGNAAELLVQTPRGNISAFAQSLQTAFARHLHHHYVHQGPVMQGRYKSKLVEPGATLATAAAWVHSLPARENTPSDFTSLPAYLQPETAPSFLDTTPVLKAVGGRVSDRIPKFAALCNTLARQDNPAITALLSASPVAVGSPAFLKEIDTLHESLRKGRGTRSLRVHGRSKRGIPQAKLIDAVAKEMGLNPKNLHKSPRKDLARPALSYILYTYGERTQKDIAKLLGLTSAAAVSLQIRRLLIARTQNSELDKKLTRIERALAL